MRAEDHTTVIAVDGGGTRCRLVLDGPGGRLAVERGSANVSSDFSAAMGAVEAGLSELAARSGRSLAQIRALPIYLGLAGMTGEGVAARVIARLHLSHARVEGDHPAALRGALGRADGALAHLGTGSFFAVQIGGQARFAGGWGARLGDEASAFWVARAALAAALVAEDGLGEKTDLTRALIARFGSADQVSAQANTETPGEIGALAPMVTQAAAAGDPLGLRILKAGSDHIAGVVTAMGWQPGMALCLTGGLGPVYRAYLPAPMVAALAPPRATPIEGGLDLAHAFAAEAGP